MDQILQKLIDTCQNYKFPQLNNYLNTYCKTLEEKEEVINAMKAKGLDSSICTTLWNACHQPDQEEQNQWAAIPADNGNNTDERITALKAYITRWSNLCPSGNHLSEAQKEINRLESSKKEDQEWKMVNLQDKNSIISYLNLHPDTAHYEDLAKAFWALTGPIESEIADFMHYFPSSTLYREADDMLDDLEWGQIDKNQQYAIEAYLTKRPSGKHAQEAKTILSAYTIWQIVKSKRDLLETKSYIDGYPQSPFINEANILFLQLKQQELERMMKERNQYDIVRLVNLMENKIFTVQELINRNLVTDSSWSRFISGNPLPPIEQEGTIEAVPEGNTDVFFFGIPATGKTCILMGLVSSDSIQVDFANLGGDYAGNLTEYVINGKVPPSTYGTFTTAVKADVIERDQDRKAKKIYHMNLIEMSGEEFAFQIAKNPDGNISFEEMGTGATNILKNNNQKAIFVIVDPTADVRHVKREIVRKDENGNEYPVLEECYVSQRMILQKLLSIFRDPSNADIAKNIVAFNIIVTKSDLLGNNIDRDKEAYTRVMNTYRHFIEGLTDFCGDYEINKKDKGVPRLYTFSLGQFYLGDVYDYDQADSDKLINAIKHMIYGKATNSTWDKVCNIVNHPII